MSWPGFDVNMAVGETLTGKDEATSGLTAALLELPHYLVPQLGLF